jgi:hypothetical protein
MGGKPRNAIDMTLAEEIAEMAALEGWATARPGKLLSEIGPHQRQAVHWAAADMAIEGRYIMTRRHSAEEPVQASTSTEPSPEDRAKELLTSMRLAAQHNSPVTPLMLSELAALVSHVTGKTAAAPPHPVVDGNGRPTTVIFRKPDGGVEVIDTAEEALALVRTMPPDVQAKPHWAAADKALSEVVASPEGSSTSAAIRAFEDALAKDREQTPRAVEIPPKPEPAVPEPVPA